MECSPASDGIYIVRTCLLCAEQSLLEFLQRFQNLLSLTSSLVLDTTRQIFKLSVGVQRQSRRQRELWPAVRTTKGSIKKSGETCHSAFGRLERYTAAGIS